MANHFEHGKKVAQPYKKVVDLLTPLPKETYILENQEDVLHLKQETKIVLYFVEEKIDKQKDFLEFIKFQFSKKEIPLQIDLIESFSTLLEDHLISLELKLNSSLKDKISPLQYDFYFFEITRDKIVIESITQSGLFYGLQTLIQLIYIQTQLRKNESSFDIILPSLKIKDWADFSDRGFMLDVSRNRIPTKEKLFEIIDVMADLKFNQLQLYFEHVFAYKGHQTVWEHVSPFTSEEIQTIDKYCQARFIQLVPNQNSFGHMHQWLKHDAYKHLAEVPEGMYHPFSEEIEPFSLCPTNPECITFLEDLYDQLLPNFSSNLFNVGFDETFDLGLGKSSSEKNRIGADRLYFNFLMKIYQLASSRNHHIQFWADMILKYPHLIKELPKDITGLIWGYEDGYPFEKHASLFHNSNINFYLCPGSSTWSSFTGRTENCIKNITQAVKAGKKYNAKGILLAEWGDKGHIQPFFTVYLPLIVASSLIWNINSEFKLDERIPFLLDIHIYQDFSSIMGKLMYNLGNIYQLNPKIPMGALAFWMLFVPTGFHEYSLIKFGAKLFLGSFAETVLEKCGGFFFKLGTKLFLKSDSMEKGAKQIDLLMERLPNASMKRKDAKEIEANLRWIMSLSKLAHLIGRERIQLGLNCSLKSLPEPIKKELFGELEKLLSTFEEQWIWSSRIGGMKESKKLLENILSYLQ